LDIVDYGEIVEANPRNTAAAIAFAAFEANPEEILLVTPSDHLIENDRSYYKAINEAKGLALEDQLVAFGLLPTKPETGYGYIEHNGSEVISFREKPDLETAKEFIKSKKFLWNSGMFCFRAGIYLEELKTHQPDVYCFAKRAHEKKSGSFINEILSDLIPSISVDYAVMEKTEKIKVIPSSFGWSDMGSFQAIYDYIPENDSRKRFSNLYIGTDKQVEFVGVENVILVETEDAIMVLNKENSQDVKKIYKRLESENPALLR
jgi:mannose-1-phosphate guanylyltransferase